MSRTVYPAAVHSPVRAPVRRVLELGGEWSLRLDPDGKGRDVGWCGTEEAFEHRIQVPGCVNALEVFSEDSPSFTTPNGYEGGCWYRRSFDLPEDWSFPRTWVLLGGIMPSARVWLNGVLLGEHCLSPVAVKMDATEALRPGSNVLTLELPWEHVGLRGGLKFGPGIWRTVELEGCSELRIENLFIRTRLQEQRILVTADLQNDGTRKRTVSVRLRTAPSGGSGPSFEGGGHVVDLPSGGALPVELTLDMPGAPAWTPDLPFLHLLTVEVREVDETVDAVTERFGLRELTVGRDCLLLNGDPVMFRAVCDEFFACPTIAPLTDPELIRKRIGTLKRLGFNAKRYHTHVPSQEELDLCDEMGLMVHAEISVISNFNVTEPYPESREVWRAGLCQIRNHASVVTYCMGNEGAQILDRFYDRAREFYADAKALAPDLLILAASGMQGEHPEVPNDYETPHLWGRFFKWSYDGLASIPWVALDPLAEKGPLVVHEYGKFTVWPDPEEDALFRDFKVPLRGNYGAMGRLALQEAGLEVLLPRIIRSSRALAAISNRTIVEEARRYPCVSGYHIISAFRLDDNRGMCDDFGHRVDPESADFPQVNAPVALCLDRGFQGRTTVSGQTLRVTCHLSNFGPSPIRNGRLVWAVTMGETLLAEGVVSDLEFDRGRNGPLCELVFQAAGVTGAMTLKAELREGDRVCAVNRWSFWAFAWPDGYGIQRVLCDLEAKGSDLDLLSMFPGVRRLDDAVSMRRGDRICKTPTDHDALDYLSATPPSGVVADHWDETLEQYAQSGGSVLLLDTGRFPEEWYAPRLPSDKAYGASIEYDIFTFFTPFRAGWDHGNAATLIESHDVMEGFPHQGFCDLQCFSMVQGARALRTAELPGAVEPIIRVVPMWMRRGPQAGPSPQNPNIARPYVTEDRFYLAEIRLGKGRVLVSSLRLLPDPAGRWLLDRLLRRLVAHGE